KDHGGHSAFEEGHGSVPFLSPDGWAEGLSCIMLSIVVFLPKANPSVSLPRRFRSQNLAFREQLRVAAPIGRTVDT
ncbi:MAG: hypothetical protein ACOVS5_02955, partial [Oligoflexus sp.]